MVSWYSRRLFPYHGRRVVTSAVACYGHYGSSLLARGNGAYGDIIYPKQQPSRLLSTSPAASVEFDIQNHPSIVKNRFRKHLDAERAKALVGGGLKRIEKQHAKGSLTARERLEVLFDKGTFHELDMLKAHRCTEFNMDAPDKQFPGDGIVTGHGLINGKVVYAFSQGTCIERQAVSAFFLGFTTRNPTTQQKFLSY